MSKERDHLHLNEPPSRRVLIVLLLTVAYMILEVVGGILTHSLALLADAGHMLTDVAALGISWMAFKMSQRPPNKRATYGYYRAEVLAALFNGLTLIVVACFIIKEAFMRLLEPPIEVASGAMMFIGMGGLIVNIVGLKILQQDRKQNINIKSAWLHILFDALGSVAVVISGLMIYFFGLASADSIGSICIAILVFYSAIQLVIETLTVLMEQSPSHIDRDAVIKEILALKGVEGVHDVHIWSITPGKEAMSTHVLVHASADYDLLQREAHRILFEKFGIEHATIQMEKDCTHPDSACAQP